MSRVPVHGQLLKKYQTGICVIAVLTTRSAFYISATVYETVSHLVSINNM